MKEVNVFSSSPARTIKQRLDKIQRFNSEHHDCSDFESYGYDYFDNEAFGVGYGGYDYDGRYESCVDAFISLFKLQPCASILEIGCAKGFILLEFFKRGFKVRGLDASKYAIENSPEEVREYISLHNASELPFDDNSFDMVLAKEVLPHLDEMGALCMISECMRVARRGSVFLEIQCSDDQQGQEMMVKWDSTHKTVKPKSWWKTKLGEINYDGAFHCKALF